MAEEVILTTPAQLKSLLIESVAIALKHHHPPGPGPTSTDEEPPLTLKEAANFLGIAPQTVYQNIKKIPSRKKHGRHYFLKSELAAYLQAGQPVTNS